MTTYWQTWAPASLAARQDNAIRRVAEFSIDRGLIFSDQPRKRLARNRAHEVGGKTLYFRRYPYGSLTAHVVGYSTVGRSRTGLERSLNDYLTASNSNLSTVVDRTVNELKGKAIRGNNVVTNLDLGAQQVAQEQLGDEVRGRRRARSADGKAARHGGLAELRPEPRREPLRAHLADHRGLHSGRPAPEPRERRPLHSGVDLQGDHRLRGARVEEVHARLDRSTTRATAPSTASRCTTSRIRTAQRSSAR